MIAYKLFRQLKDGAITSLFINKTERYKAGEWLQAEDHKTKGYAHRPGWHCLAKPEAPHLKVKTTTQNRVWYKVKVKDFAIFERPQCQGGKWYLAQQMKIIGELHDNQN